MTRHRCKRILCKRIGIRIAIVTSRRRVKPYKVQPVRAVAGFRADPDRRCEYERTNISCHGSARLSLSLCSLSRSVSPDCPATLESRVWRRQSRLSRTLTTDARTVSYGIIRSGQRSKYGSTKLKYVQ